MNTAYNYPYLGVEQEDLMSTFSGTDYRGENQGWLLSQRPFISEGCPSRAWEGKGKEREKRKEKEKNAIIKEGGEKPLSNSYALFPSYEMVLALYIALCFKC